MKWKRIPKESASQPDSGNYKAWKQLIADEGFHQCVYCAIPDASLGGLRSFHIEHYKPKSKFKDLENDINNLFYACPICNTFKSNDWPAEPNKDHSINSYPNPSILDYTDLFNTDPETGTISGKYIASKYIVEKLFLNRSQLIMERRLHYLYAKDEYLREGIQQLCPRIDQLEDKDLVIDLYRRVSSLYNTLNTLKNRLIAIAPYDESDIQR